MAISGELLTEALSIGAWPKGKLMNIVVKGERAVIGDCVLLGCGDSERL